MPQIPQDHAITGRPEAPQSVAPDDAMHAAWHNEASTKDAQANFLDGLNDLLYHPESGFLTQQGAAALNSHQAAQQGVAKLFQSATDALGNDEQRKLFDQATRPLLDNAMAQLQRHAQGQSRVYDAQASQARRQSATQLAINAYTPGGDNTLYRQAAAAAHSELENTFRHQHGEPDHETNQGVWQHYLQHGHDGTSGMAALHTGIVTRLIENGQPQHAEAYLEEAGQDLSPATREKLGLYIHSAHDHRAAYSATLQAQASGEDPAQQQQKLNSLLESGDISPSVHKIAGQKLNAAHQQQQAQQQQNDEHILQNVWQLKQGNPHAALSDLAPGDYAYLRSRGLEGNAEAILQTHPATDDPALFNQLYRQASEDPVNFAQISLLKVSGRLSKAHMDYLKGLQKAVNKQDPHAIAAGRQVNEAVDVMRDEMKLSGADMEPEPGSEWAQQLAQRECAIRDKIIVAQLAKKGTLSRDEATQLVRTDIADYVLSGKGGLYWDGHGYVKSQAQKSQPGAELGLTDQYINPTKPGQELPPFSPLETLAHGAPAAAQTMAEAHKQDAGISTYPAKLAIGAKLPHGMIAAGDSADSRVYEVKMRRKHGAIDLNTISDETGYDYDQLKALNKISHDGVWRIENGTKIILPPPARDEDPDDKHKPVIDIEKSVDQINKDREDHFTGWCGKHVFDAIIAGRLPGGEELKRTPYAAQAGPSLLKLGFRVVLKDSSGLAHYTPRKGDVVVLQPYSAQKSKKTGKKIPAGHIAMYDGKYWVSDKRQDGASRIWAGPSFEKENVGMKVYRP